MGHQLVQLVLGSEQLRHHAFRGWGLPASRGQVSIGQLLQRAAYLGGIGTEFALNRAAHEDHQRHRRQCSDDGKHHGDGDHAVSALACGFLRTDRQLSARRYLVDEFFAQ
ncbi:hypothetical protein D3C72_1839470 [compost metagenome]